MGCRCSDITKLKNDISNLKKALSCVGQAADTKSDVISNLNNASSTFESSVILDNNESTVANSIKTAHDTASSSVDAAKSAISNSIIKAEQHLNSLESEDESFHEEERRKNNMIRIMNRHSKVRRC